MSCENGDLKMVKLLVNEKTFSRLYNIQNKNGLKPLELAQNKITELNTEKIF